MEEAYVADELKSAQQEGKGLALSPRFQIPHLCDDSPMSHRKCESISAFTEASLSAVVVEITHVARLVTEPRFTCTRTLPEMDFSNVEAGTLLWRLHCGNMPSSKTSICKHPGRIHGDDNSSFYSYCQKLCCSLQTF